MNTILALRGRGNSGKTTTIKMLRELLLANNFQEEWNWIGADFIAVFVKNEKKIGVTSSGDTYDLVSEKLAELIKNECAICICACRTRGGTNTAVTEFPNYSYQFIEKTVDETDDEIIQENINQSDAQSLYKEIDRLV